MEPWSRGEIAERGAPTSTLSLCVEKCRQGSMNNRQDMRLLIYSKPGAYVQISYSRGQNSRFPPESSNDLACAMMQEISSSARLYFAQQTRK